MVYLLLCLCLHRIRGIRFFSRDMAFRSGRIDLGRSGVSKMVRQAVPRRRLACRAGTARCRRRVGNAHHFTGVSRRYFGGRCPPYKAGKKSREGFYIVIPEVLIGNLILKQSGISPIETFGDDNQDGIY